MINEISNRISKIKNISINNCRLLENIIKTLKQKIKGKREIMYSDIINLIIRDGIIEEDHKKIVIWCNYKIRLGKIFVEFE